MSTETATTSESFTAGEAAYFQSGGNDTAGLEAEVGQQPGSDQQGSAPSAQPGAANEQRSDGDDPDMLVTVGPDGKPRNGKGQFVPHEAFHAVREKYKATREELQATREKLARGDERFNVLNEILGASEKPAQTQAAAIDPETDPVGALKAAFQQIETLKAELTKSTTQQAARDDSRALMSAYQNDAVRYVKEKPEFADAYGFLIESRDRELEAGGMTDARQRKQLIAKEERAMVEQAFSNQRSPAQLLHNIAVARGFAPKAQTTTTTAQNDPMKKIEAIANGQKTAGASLTGAGGMSGEGLTAAALADMSEDEFAAVQARIGKAKMAQLLGG